MNQSGVTSYDQVGAIDNCISFWDALDIIIICKFCCPTYENAHVKVQENEFSVDGSLEIGASLVSFSMISKADCLDEIDRFFRLIFSRWIKPPPREHQRSYGADYPV